MPSWTIALLFGTALPAWFPLLPPLWYAVVAIAAGGLLVRFAPGRISWWLLVFCLGLGWGVAHGHRIVAGLLPVALEREELRLTGRVVGLPETALARGRPVQRFLFSVHSCQRQNGSACATGLRRVRLSWFADVAVASDQRWELTVRLRRPHGFANVGGFDYESWLVAQGIGATGSVIAGAANRLAAPPRPWHPNHWRQTARDTLAARLAPFASRPLLLALLVGDGSALGDEAWALLRATGTVHLFVVSGLHVGMSGGLLLLLGRLWRRSPWGGDTQRAALLGWLFALLGAGGYAVLAGFGLPIQRALIMFAVAGAALVFRRERRPRDAWLLALVVVLLWDPLAVLQAGFWFSFLAVAAILTAVTGRPGPVRPPRRRWLQQLWRVQWATFVMSVPVLLGLTGMVPLISLLANAVAIPLVSVAALPAALVAWLLDLGGVGGGWFWGVADQTLTGLWWLLETLATLGRTLEWRPGGWGWAGWLGAGMAVVLALLPRPLPGRWLAPLFLLPLLWPRPDLLGDGEVRLTVFDVGQGLAVLVQTRTHAMLYDTGPTTATGGAVAELTVLPALQRLGVSRLDLLVISHGDNDHAGGWRTIADQLDVVRMLAGEPLVVTSAGTNTAPCRAGDRWEWDGVLFSVLHPSWQSSRSNDNSCVVGVAAGGGLLLTGDISHAMESHLVASGALAPFAGGSTQAGVVIAPHHGSASSSSARFVAATRPRYVIATAGYRNAFNHPSPAVVARWQQAGAELLNTAEHGMLRLLLRERTVALETRYRSDRPRFWQMRSERPPVSQPAAESLTAEVLRNASQPQP